jgi:type IV pilus assembly protein PilB
MTREIEEVIKSGGGAREVKEAAKSQGVLDIYQDAVLKIFRGMTSLEEVERVIGLNIES